MDTHSSRNIQNLLLQKRKEVLNGIQDRDGILIEPAPDALDETQNATMREFAVRRLDRDALRLREIDEALQRARDGVYGVCVECEEPINPKRLAALPWAAMCVRCQEAEEHRQESGEQVRAAG
jgi:DnaK suppressor protein